MAEVKGNRGQRHPDAVACLEGPGEEGAAMLREHECECTRAGGGNLRHRCR